MSTEQLLSSCKDSILSSNDAPPQIEFQHVVSPRKIYELAKRQGFYPADSWNLQAALMGVCSEAAEAYEADRNGEGLERIGEELGDTVMRLFGIAEHLGIDILEHIFKKFIANHSREFLHGRKTI